MESREDDLSLAKELREKGELARAIELYKSLLTSDGTAPVNLVVQQRTREQAIYDLTAVYAAEGSEDGLRYVFSVVQSQMIDLPKARVTKIVRSQLDILDREGCSKAIQEKICEEIVEWCRSLRRTFLRHRVQTRLAMLYYHQAKYTQCLDLLSTMIREVKALNDNLLLVEIHLIESKLHFAVKNIPKSKAALTAGRTYANSIHCPTLTQAEIDLQTGILHAEEGEFQTAYSYFFEASESFSSVNDSRALRAVKYMMLAKIMCDNAADVPAIATAKSGNPQDSGLAALVAIAKCHQERSLRLFEDATVQYKAELEADDIVQRHISELHERLLEKNILRVLEPYSKVEISHVAKLVRLPAQRVQAKLGEMVLDKKLIGTLDQGNGVLLLFDEDVPHPMHSDLIAALGDVTKVVDALHRAAEVATH